MFGKPPESIVPTLEDLIGNSSATDGFKTAVSNLSQGSKPDGNTIKANAASPGVKVLRTIMQLLESHCDWQIESVAVEGQSGCSDYRGDLTVNLADGDTKQIRFIWDCAWKAEKEGLNGFWGGPDQQKAAQLYGYQCFEVFEVTG